MRHKHWMLALLLLPLSAYGEGLSYSYAELNYIVEEEIDFDVSGLGSANDDGDGWNFNASFAIDQTFFVIGSYSDVSLDDSNLDLDFLTLGLGGRNTLSEGTDVYGVFSYENFEVKVPGFSEDDEDGFGLAGGLRSMVMDGLELNGQIKYSDIGDFDGLGFKVGALYAFAPNWAVGGDYQTSTLEGDDVEFEIDEIRLGLRYFF